MVSANVLGVGGGALLLIASATAAGPFGTFTGGAVGTATGLGIGGGVTFVGAAPEWEFWYDNTMMRTIAETESVLTTSGAGSVISSFMPGPGSQWLFGLRTTVSATDSTFGGGGGVRIELMDGVTAMAVPTATANLGAGGTNFSVNLPVNLTGFGATAAGPARATLTAQALTLRVNGDRTGTTLSQVACFDNGSTSVVQGNVVGKSAADTGPDAATTRAILGAAGGRSTADALAAFRAGSAPTNSATTFTASASADPCAQSASTTTASLYDYALTLPAWAVTITTTGRITEDVTWTIPFNIRLSFV